MDAHQYLAHFRAVELQTAAADHRLARLARDTPRRSRPVLRLYARIWWASRPRATSWASALLDAPAVRYLS
ncbi:hypothetical protein [Pseudonocardia sp. GCM10023141]|uniref:hypothetical protein n=1 Tax=Pseudonocardia sp. GCM10023141 TaxID=3252653 RepID=UPI003616C5D5